MDIGVIKVIGVVFLAIVFIVTVLLMPWIFGVDTPSPTASEPDAPTGAAAPVEPAIPRPGLPGGGLR